MNARQIRRTYADQLSWPDSKLLQWAASIVGVPKAAPADSFALHAPLELMARALLLPMAAAEAREGARERLVQMVDAYLSAAPGVPDPRPVSHDSVADGMAALIASMQASDLDDVDRHASWLGSHASVSELRRGLGAAVAPSLAAAAHGTIALHLLDRSPAIGPSLIRGVAREIGRHPDWVVPWEGLAVGGRPLMGALLDAPLLGMPGSNFILPMVMNGSDAARKLLAEVSSNSVDALRSLSRVAAWSMLQDAREHAPYGWTHTLTIPQAVMSIDLEPGQAVSIAASQVVGFRASMGTRALEPSAPLPTMPPGTAEELATEAVHHFDAHLVKYTLACLDAAALDPEMGNLYRHAASYLHDWWLDEPDDGFFDS